MKDGWSKHFRRLGGVKYLEVLILEIDVVKYVGGNLGARCVALLLKIMSYVYTENVSNGKNTIGLVRRVFDLLRTCVLVNERVRSTLRRRTSRDSTGSLKRRSSRDSTGSAKARASKENVATEEDDLSRLLRYATVFLVRIFSVEADDTNIEDTELLVEFQDDWRGVLSYTFVKCPIARVRSTVAENLLGFCKSFEKVSSVVGSTNGPRSALISTSLSMLNENQVTSFSIFSRHFSEMLPRTRNLLLEKI